MKYSIVIPTYNHCDDLLKPCIDSILKTTLMSDVEIIISANGCVDNTKQYLEELKKLFSSFNHQDHLKIIWNESPLGYTTATNMGIRKSIGEYVILMNNDTLLLDFQGKNDWLNLLERPFKNNEKVAMTGPLELYDYDVESNFLVFCLAMIKRSIFTKIGLLDEIFSPGYGEDIDFSMKLKKIGYEFVEVFEIEEGYAFPFWHKGGETFGEIPAYANEIIPRNQSILRERYLK